MNAFYNNRPLANILDENDSADPGDTVNDYYLKVETITKKWANEISWSVGTCESIGLATCTPNAGYRDNMNFTQICRLAPGYYKIMCKDCYGDSWGGGYLLINGIKYCDQFTGKNHEIDITVGNPEGKPIMLNY